MDIMVIIHQMVQLFVIMGLGYLLNKVGIIDREFNRKLTKLLLNCTLPALILASVLEQHENRDFSMVGMVFLVSVIMFVSLPVMAFIAVKLMRYPVEQQGIYMFMYTFSNVGFMGFPVIESIFGSTGVVYAAIVNIVFNVTSFTLGVLLINYGTVQKGEKLINLKKLLSPGVSISVLSIVVYLAGITLPDDISSVISSVGSITSPLAMILIGATLATMDVRSVFNEWRIYPFTFVKQVIMPLLLWAMMRVFISDSVMLGTITVLLLMPVANSSVLFANEYDRDEKLAAKGVFITTVFSMLSVPVMLYFIG